MSVTALTTVWDKSTQRGDLLVVLLILADNADENGLAWGIEQEYLAQKARLSLDELDSVLESLVDAGELWINRTAAPPAYRVLPYILSVDFGGNESEE